MMRDVGLIGIAGALLWRRQARWAIHVTSAARQEGNRGEEDDKLRLRGDRGGGHGGGGRGNVREGLGRSEGVTWSKALRSDRSETIPPFRDYTPSGSRRMRVITVVVCSPRR